MKRIVLFVLTNLAIVVVLGIVASLLGVNRFLTANGLNLTALLGFALIKLSTTTVITSSAASTGSREPVGAKA